jgi:hypothetical protein
MMSKKCHMFYDFLNSKETRKKRKVQGEKKGRRKKREMIAKSRVSVNILILVKSMFAEMIGLHEQISLGYC